MNIRSEVATQFMRVAAEQGRRLASLADDLRLEASGLDSLCFAVIVARLDDSLGIDPFTTAEDAKFPVTFGEFVNFYENATK